MAHPLGFDYAVQAALDLKSPLVSPSFTTPTLGVATATTINKVAITAPATSATLTIAEGKTLTASNTLTLAAGADGYTLTVPATGTAALLGTANVFTVGQTFTGTQSIYSQNPSSSVMDFILATTTGAGSNLMRGYKFRGTLASPTATQSQDTLMIFQGAGYGTTGYVSAAQLDFRAAENLTDTANGSDIVFRTKTIGTTTMLSRMEVRNTGNILVGPAGTADGMTAAGSVAIAQDLAHRGSKAGFFNVTPATRPTAYTQTYSTASKTVANPTSATLTDNSGGTADTTLAAVEASYTQATIRNNFADLAAMVNKLTADVLADKKVITQIIDDFQSLGLLQ
jgi:hypothetical protein